MKFGLDEKTIQLICATFHKYKSIDRAILYGSRAKGNFRPGSDIDLTLKGLLSLEDLYSVRNDLDDLNLPYTFDISIYSEIDNQNLIDHIERVGVDFYVQKAG